MDSNNNQQLNQPVQPQIATPPPATPPSGSSPAQKSATVSQKSHKNMIMAVVLLVLVLAIVGILAYYFLYMSKPKPVPQASVPKPSPQASVVEEDKEILGVSDLDAVLTEAAKSDSSLDSELKALEGESSF